jgi:hypothetical protein
MAALNCEELKYSQQLKFNQGGVNIPLLRV